MSLRQENHLLIPGTGMRNTAAALLVAIASMVAGPAFAEQSFRGKNVYFGDMHWHSCLSQDAQSTSPSAQYQSMLQDYGLDFSMASEHAEAANAGITKCDTYLPLITINTSNGPIFYHYTGEEVATAQKAAADTWNGAFSHDGMIKFVTFPGYEWAPDARCWMARATNLFPADTNALNDTPGHINYFFSNTTGWTFGDDVWQPGDGDSGVCATVSALGFGYYDGSKDWVDEILGQLIHQRDDPDRDYDLMIQYNHPAASTDKGGSSDHLAHWYDFEHRDTYCSLADGSTAPCGQNHCEAFRRYYGVTGVEWYTNQEASIGSLEKHGLTGEPCGVSPLADALSERCFHDRAHVPDRFVSSHALREGYDLSWHGGSDSHSGRRFKPAGDFPGGRGAGSGSLTVVYAGEASRPSIWDGMAKRHTYALSRFRGVGPVHKGRVDFYSTEPGNPREFVMGDTMQASWGGPTVRDFTISAASADGTTGIVPVEVRLYKVNHTTPLSIKTDTGFYWLDDLTGDPGKLGTLVGRVGNTTSSPTLTHTFTNVTVFPGDALFAVVPYSDFTWLDEYYDTDKEPLDEDGDGGVDPGKSPFAHTDNNTWARTTPIYFHGSSESAVASPVCSHVTFNGGVTDPLADGGTDGALTGDTSVLPVANPAVYRPEWNAWHFTVPTDSQYVDLTFFTKKDEDNIGHLFGIRIDGQLVYSGRAGIDHDADALVELKNVPFALKKGLHLLEVHMDDQEFAVADSDANYHCNDYDGPPGFVDMIAFHNDVDAFCGDVTPPEITCPASITLECNTAGGVAGSDAAIAAFLAGASATDDIDTTPTITHPDVGFFPTGTTTIAFTAKDDALNADSCTATVTVNDTIPPSLAAFTLSPATLGPPNHNLITMSVPTLTATDVCDASPAIRCSVSSSEVPNGLGDGDKANDIVFNGTTFATQSTGELPITTSGGQGTFTLALRAERSGKGNGRTYTASCVGVDGAGNRSSAKTSTATVPK